MTADLAALVLAFLLTLTIATAYRLWEKWQDAEKETAHWKRIAQRQHRLHADTARARQPDADVVAIERRGR